MSISLVRIDDRLVHGQVATQWTQYAHADIIVIVDDATAKDAFLSDMFKKLAPMGTTVEIYTTEDAAEPLKRYQDDDSVKILVLMKTPGPILKLLDMGVKIPEFILGGMGSKAGRKKLYRNITATEEEKDQMRKLCAMGCQGYVRIIPNDKAVSVMQYLN